MTRLQKHHRWALLLGVTGLFVALLLVRGPGYGAAQEALDDKPQATETVKVPEEPAATDPVAPARVLTPEDRALTTICVGDKGEPLDDVIVDIFRQTAGESPLSPPRVESFGRTKTQDGGRFSVTLPLIKSAAAKGEETSDVYVVYFMAPRRQIKSVIVANDTKLPTKIAIPTTSTERIYLPTHYLVLATTKGISVSPMLSAPRFGTKDGQLARVEQFADHRNSDDKTPGAEAVTEDPSPSTVLVPTVEGAHVAYPFKTEDTEKDARKLVERFTGRANIHLESRPESLGVSYLHVRAPASVQDEIRAVVNFLTKQRNEPVTDPSSDSGGVQSSYAPPPIPADNPGSMTVAQSGPTARIPVIYALRHASPREVADIIDSQFSGRVEPITADDRTRQVLVAADPDTHAEIRGVINFLDRAAPPVPASAGDRAMMGMAALQKSTQYGYLALAQLQQQAAQERIQPARQQLSDAKTDDERKSARAQLRQLLAEIFSQDMQTREKQAAEIESRLSKLRQQYREREKVKDEIIDLQLKVIEQDAAGLGFPSTGPTTGPPPTGTGQTRIPESSEQSQIARERVEALRQQFKVFEREYQIGKVTIDRVLRASNDLLEAELEVAESAAKRIKILEQQAANLEMLEAVTTQVYKAGKVGVEDVLAAKADRLAAQTRLDRDLVLLRRFVDKNHDGIVDLWAYYKAGKEVHRDVDTDYDGKIDYAEGVDDGKGDDVPNASDAPMD